MRKKKHDPVHPGEILLEEFLKPMGLSQNQPRVVARLFEVAGEAFR